MAPTTWNDPGAWESQIFCQAEMDRRHRATTGQTHLVQLVLLACCLSGNRSWTSGLQQSESLSADSTTNSYSIFSGLWLIIRSQTNRLEATTKQVDGGQRVGQPGAIDTTKWCANGRSEPFSVAVGSRNTGWQGSDPRACPRACSTSLAEGPGVRSAAMLATAHNNSRQQSLALAVQNSELEQQQLLAVVGVSALGHRLSVDCPAARVMLRMEP